VDLESPASHRPTYLSSKSTYPTPRIKDLPAFFPFSTLKDFEQAEVFADYGATDAHIDRQLALSSMGITLKDAKDYHGTLALAIRLSGGKVDL
jgi:hypothetical protein